MRELPILFSAPMVRAILEGRKTQTRRPMKEQPFAGGYYQGDISLDQNGYCTRFGVEAVGGGAFLSEEFLCPYGDPRDRDRLWVREAWRVPDSLNALSGFQIAEKCFDAGYREPWCPIRYEADGHLNSFKDWREFETTPGVATPGRYRHARFMPRWASRITLEVTGVRVERLQDISETDAEHEGVERWVVGDDGWRDYMLTPEEEAVAGVPPMTAKQSFKTLWESINNAGSWDANPWVWVIEFNCIEQEREAA